MEASKEKFAGSQAKRRMRLKLLHSWKTQKYLASTSTICTLTLYHMSNLKKNSFCISTKNSLKLQ